MCFLWDNDSMFPVIFSVGPFELRTMSLFLVLAFFVMSFIFYRKIRDEHYPEVNVFDGYLLSLLLGFLAGRVAFVITHVDRFGWNVWQWLDIVSYPGVVGSVMFVVAALYLARHIRFLKIDPFEVLDIWSIAVSVGLAIIWLGWLMDGTNYGYATSLPIGLSFPGSSERHLPIQLVMFLYFCALAWFLNWSEYRYRTFSWYRSGKKTAQAGFLISLSLLATSTLWAVVSWMRPPSLVLAGISLDFGVAMVGVITGFLLLYTRTGRKIGWSKRERVASQSTIEKTN